MDTVSGLAIGYATGGTAGAFTGANADWNNRQLHNREIKKIKDIAEQYAKEQGISVEQAENDLMVQAMRDIDKQYADKHAGYDDSAEKFLRKNAGTFYDSESKTNMLMFANNGYYEDSSKFANQTGYATERNRLLQLNNQYSAKDRTNDINYKTNDAIVGGTIKGIKNVPSNLINGGATLLNNVFHTDAVPLVQPAARYANEAEAFVGNQVGENVVNAVSIVTVGLGSVAQEARVAANLNREAQAARNAARVENNIYRDGSVSNSSPLLHQDIVRLQGTSPNVGDFTGLRGATMEEIVSRVPKDWTVAMQKDGKGVRFLDTAGNERIRVHQADYKAPVGSNSNSGWVLRISNGGKGRNTQYFDHNGNVGGYKDNGTHIPIAGNPVLNKGGKK